MFYNRAILDSKGTKDQEQLSLNISISPNGENRLNGENKIDEKFKKHFFLQTKRNFRAKVNPC